MRCFFEKLLQFDPTYKPPDFRFNSTLLVSADQVCFIDGGIFLESSLHVGGLTHVKHNFLFVDDDPLIRKTFKAALEEDGFFVKAVANGFEAIAHIRQKTAKYSLVLVDKNMPEFSGPEVIRAILDIDPTLTLVGFSCDPSDEAHNSSLEAGALTFIQKDIGHNKLIGILHRLCRDVEKREKKLGPAPESERQKLIASVGMAGVSEHLADVARLIHKLAPAQETVLIRGENGTGKEQVARALHGLSSRRLGPFIAVNCAAITKSILESELFGHEKGAFTGAGAAKSGFFVAANNGTIFLDEIGDMPASSQAALLRVLQSREVTPVGSSQTKKINVRVVAATNAPLEARIALGEFREDLYHRLNVLPINLLPLHLRPDDIPALIWHFMSAENAKSGVEMTITDLCVAAMTKLPWRGNVRALEGAIIRMRLLSGSDAITVDSLHLIDGEHQTETSRHHVVTDLEILKSRHLDEEYVVINRALREGDNLSAVATALGISRSTLRSRLKALKIKNPFNDSEDL